MTSDFQLRDVFNPELVNRLAANIAGVWPSFDQQAFTDAINPNLPAHNFGARSSLIADTLHAYLPDDFPAASQILIDALGPELETEMFVGYEGFEIMPQCLFVSRYGIEFFDAAINALYEMTKRFTAEGDIRPFIQRYPDRTLVFLHEITRDPNPFARRLASEGTRPRLPLASRLPEFQRDPMPVIALLDKLKTDPNLMVRRSVANNLNDIAKDNPDVVVAALERWNTSDPSPEMTWITSHALRTLLKQGNPGALRLLGYDPDVQVTVSPIRLSDAQPAIGDEIAFAFDVTSGEVAPCKLMIDYVVYFMKANGKQAPKVFKAAIKTIKPGETITIKKRHSFQQRSTRVHYPGEHGLALQINGRAYLSVDFMLMH